MINNNVLIYIKHTSKYTILYKLYLNEKEIKDKLIENQFEIENDYDQDDKMLNDDSDEMKE